MTLEYHSEYIMKKAHRESLLNRQRRIALYAAIMAALTLFFAFSGGRLASSLARESYSEGIYVSVERGDSLWKIAGEYKPDGKDTRDFMRTIAKTNNLSGTTVYEGQMLYIPQ